MIKRKNDVNFITELRKRGLIHIIPAPLRRLGKLIIGRQCADESWWLQQYESVLKSAVRVEQRSDLPCLGIVKDQMLRHSYYEAACLELGVPYNVIDISGADWISQVEDSGCKAFAIRPFVLTRVGKGMYDDRVRVIVDEMQKQIIPSLNNLWLYESKSRCADWLQVHKVASPKTWVFYDEKQAFDFVANAIYPMMFKLDIGAGALGVEIVRNVRHARRLVCRCFGKGMSVPQHDPRDRQWGMIIFQEYISDAEEWRVIRLGDSFFGHRKVKRGEFHSGTKLKSFDTPPPELLDLAEKVSSIGGFDNVALDILETPDGGYYVIEVQAYFGASRSYQMMIDDVPGRFVRDDGSGEWLFEAGDFTRNAGCNMRVQGLYKNLGYDLGV